MRLNLRQTIIVGIGILLAGLALATEAYKYTTDEGVVSYTDDEEMVPPKYKETAEKVELEKFVDYPKLTIVEPKD